MTKAFIHIVSLLLIIVSSNSLAQTSPADHVPQLMIYQSIARDHLDHPVTETQIKVTIDVVQQGVSKYLEEHVITTDSRGTYTTYIGQGTGLSGSLANIDWSLPIKYETATEIADSLMHYGAPKRSMTVVPYAFFAGNGWFRNGDNLYLNDENVGMGTTPGNSRLSVRGDAHITGQLFYKGNEQLHVSGNNIGIGTATPDYPFTVAGALFARQGVKFPDGTIQRNKGLDPEDQWKTVSRTANTLNVWWNDTSTVDGIYHNPGTRTVRDVYREDGSLLIGTSTFSGAKLDIRMKDQHPFHSGLQVRSFMGPNLSWLRNDPDPIREYAQLILGYQATAVNLGKVHSYGFITDLGDRPGSAGGGFNHASLHIGYATRTAGSGTFRAPDPSQGEFTYTMTLTSRSDHTSSDNPFVGINQTIPKANLHVAKAGDGTMALFENTNPAGQGIDIKLNVNDAGHNNRYIQFFKQPASLPYWDEPMPILSDRAGSIVGETLNDIHTARVTDGCWLAENIALSCGLLDILGTSCNVAAAVTCELQWEDEAGVSYRSGWRDYAEWMPKLDSTEQFGIGDVLGIHGGKISRKTIASDFAMATSLAPIVLGNMPDSSNQHLFEKVAFMGQVPVRLNNTAHKGDYLITSGKEDGSSIAIPKEKLRYEHLNKIIGRSWAESIGEKIPYVNAGVGIPMNDWLSVYHNHLTDVNKLKAELKEMENEHQSLETKKTVLQQQNEEMEQSILKLEQIIEATQKKK